MVLVASQTNLTLYASGVGTWFITKSDTVSKTAKIVKEQRCKEQRFKEERTKGGGLKSKDSKSEGSKSKGQRVEGSRVKSLAKSNDHYSSLFTNRPSKVLSSRHY